MLNVISQGNIEITEAIHAHITECANQLMKYSTTQVLSLGVHVKKEHKTQYSVAITGDGKSCTANAADLYKAISDAFDKMETVFAKDKSVKLSRRNNPEHIDLPLEEE